MKNLFLLLIVLAFTINVKAQGESVTIAPITKESKNTIYLNLGYGGVAVSANLNYERRIMKLQNSLLSSVWIKAHGGLWAIWDSGGTQFTLAAVGLSGQGNHHFEYSLGITSLYDKTGYDIGLSNYNGGYTNEPTKLEYTSFLVYATAGYRYQKPQGHFIFRTGFSYPEFLYVGAGIAF